MAISAFIPEPENEFEQLFSVPVATEAFFQACWEPAVEPLGLQWVPGFASGIDVTKDDLPAVLAELEKLKLWAETELSGDRRDKMLERLERLAAELPHAFRREGAVVFIG
ncbi:hypothetical protein [Paenibacillus humicola]|uniref:hypothetical protein n=1 Tax=Paenibacillus humicola TaxID=3110540 RepID=UPI00237A2F50|nr:hypothetical protein [Paenibacillus humicola]